MHRAGIHVLPAQNRRRERRRRGFCCESPAHNRVGVIVEVRPARYLRRLSQRRETSPCRDTPLKRVGVLAAADRARYARRAGRELDQPAQAGSLVEPQNEAANARAGKRRMASYLEYDFRQISSRRQLRMKACPIDALASICTAAHEQKVASSRIDIKYTGIG